MTRVINASKGINGVSLAPSYLLNKQSDLNLLKSILRKRHWLRTLKEVKIENFDNFFPRGISSKAKEILPQHAMINFSFHLLGSSFLCTILTVALH